jgi:hypothetical protein
MVQLQLPPDIQEVLANHPVYGSPKNLRKPLDSA